MDLDARMKISASQEAPFVFNTNSKRCMETDYRAGNGQGSTLEDEFKTTSID